MKGLDHPNIVKLFETFEDRRRRAAISLSLSLSLSADDGPTAAEAPQHPLWVAADSLIWGGPRAERARRGQAVPVALVISSARYRGNRDSPASRPAQPIK